MKSVEMSGRLIIVSERWIFKDYRDLTPFYPLPPIPPLQIGEGARG